jgi:tRNA G18 (ribose-2'-O)-methylase SpoU
MRSNVNVSRIVRAAGCCGVTRIVACGDPKIDRKIVRDAIDYVQLQTHRSLAPPLVTLKSQGFQLVGLEQVSGSCSLFDFQFVRRTVLVIGHERHGLSDELLQLMDHVVEIPVYGLPYSHNAATAAAMVLYEFCRQYPDG